MIEVFLIYPQKVVIWAKDKIEFSSFALTVSSDPMWNLQTRKFKLNIFHEEVVERIWNLGIIEAKFHHSSIFLKSTSSDRCLMRKIPGLLAFLNSEESWVRQVLIIKTGSSSWLQRKRLSSRNRLNKHSWTYHLRCHA
jgi:hypothetical protein